ncbi:triose-phosphate isomerase [Candidatus Pantoea edessiphila]|uniref:Triosephosphate isomerase n=1 Tax=Candidatus Pantoea edessiphila TaxID=2044610 RepID=A0A2P5T2B2_9GAMM|nr:triose-phosphate isomerase [Candidatus Pantoea edessiphila]PPI88706.1 triose-phosphate isomerase [Candidatus Pantoea edessiphila]
MKYPLIIGNWKLNGSNLMVNSLINQLNQKLFNIKNCHIAVAPPILYIDRVSKVISDNIKICAQNVDISLCGAYTGDVSIEMLKEIGVQYVIVGHSERRNYHKEDDNYISKKYSIIKSFDLIPILCIGENETQNKTGKTKEICKLQLASVLDNQGVQAFENAVIAYEPIWAIGTGRCPTPVQIQSVHKFIRDYIATYDMNIAKKLIIQYGGSINEKNAAEIISKPDIDGLLVGNSSLNASVFSKIVKIAQASKLI